MSGKLNLNYILYTAFRLFPFIVVSFFTMSSILNQDLKGVVYLAGLLFACFFAIIIGSAHPMLSTTTATTDENNMVCKTLTLTDSGRLSTLPLGMVVFTYTFSYLVDIIIKYNMASQNIPTLILFPAVIIGETIWNRKYQCATIIQIVAAFVIGAVWGVIWSRLIQSTGALQLQYFNGINNSQSCSRPSKQKFKCTINQ